MKYLYAFVALIFLTAASGVRAQTGLIQHQITKTRNSPPATGRDFWFAIPSNYFGEDLGGKSLDIYITSQHNTTAYVELESGNPVPVPVSALKVSTFRVPESWEMESSGIVEPGAVHIWSSDADLTVYFMSHNDATSDGTYIVPTIGLGTDYVVAAYGALYEAPSFDLPSEFTVAATADNTVVNITPSCNLRKTLGDSSATVIAYPAGQTFQITLNQGESVQFMSVEATGTTGFDVTGTIIHSNHPIGVIGGSMCTNIPLDYPYCDHVEHMLPPVRTWGKTYYATSFAQPAGVVGHDFGLYLFISSEPYQVIFSYDSSTGQRVECVIGQQYGIYWDEKALAQKFWSDAPFSVVEYINSGSYPDRQNGNGDPAEVVLPTREQYSKTISYIAPVSDGSAVSYGNYLNVIVNLHDENNTTIDGRTILFYTHQPVDDTFDIFTIPHLSAGVHVITGDSLGVGVYGYGYGLDESYAWSGPIGIATFSSQDTISPTAQITGACYGAFVHLADSGMNPGNISQSKVTYIQIDSSQNMTYTLDSNWIEGAGSDTAGYGISVIDPTKPAYIRVDAFDGAGNRTTIVSTYTPQVAAIEPPTQNFGAVIPPGVEYEYDTLINTGSIPFFITAIHLLHGDRDFTLDSGITSGVLAVGAQRIVRIAFHSTQSTTEIDSILLSNGCETFTAGVIANGGSADFMVTNQYWLNEPFPPPADGYVKTVTIQNLTLIPITINSAWWADTNFVALDTFPLSVPASGSRQFRIAYFPTVLSETYPDITQGSWTSPQVLESNGTTRSIRNDTLFGNAALSVVDPGSAIENFNLSAIPNPVTGSSVTIEYSLAEAADITISIYDALGREIARPVSGVSTGVGTWRREADLTNLPNGAYVIRLTSPTLGRTISKQFVIER